MGKVKDFYLEYMYDDYSGLANTRQLAKITAVDVWPRETTNQPIAKFHLDLQGDRRTLCKTHIFLDESMETELLNELQRIGLTFPSIAQLEERKGELVGQYVEIGIAEAGEEHVIRFLRLLSPAILDAASSVSELAAELRKAQERLDSALAAQPSYHVLPLPSSATGYWMNQYVGATAFESMAMRELELENARLRRMVVDSMLKQCIFTESGLA